ncbi:hypothetical protein EV174_003592 [Coemansia sp. RSA 2320]|nr:hypothetical protein EV174_003592 [Coemansia sp. RSA 2320]
MVSYTDLSPLKQPAVPVAVGLNDPLPDLQPSPVRGKGGKDTRAADKRDSGERISVEEWRRGWEQMHSKMLYFKGVTEDALPELQQLFKAYRGIRLNIDPHESLEIAGNVEFRNVYDTEKAMVILNNRKLQSSAGTLILSPLSNAELGPPPNGGYICIKHIPDDASEAAFYDFMRPSGPLYSCSFPTTASGQRKDLAYACFVDLAYAITAIEQLNFSEFQGNTISMQQSRPPRKSRASTSESNRSADANMVPKSQDALQTTQSATPLVPTAPPRQHNVSAPADECGKNRDAVTVPAPQPALPSSSASPQSSSQVAAEITQSQSQLHQHLQPGRGATSPTGTSDGPGNGLGGVIVPGKLFVTNLHPTVSHKELFALFKKYGYIQSARVSIDPATKKSRGHGIVQFSDPTAALDALKECQGADIKGRKITMYQYEHVNKNMHPSLSPRAGSSPQEWEAPHIGNSSRPHVATATTTTPSADATAAGAALATTAATAPMTSIQANSVPFPRSNSVASNHAADPLLDPAMLRNLSDASRNEILAQKLVSAIASNPAVDVRDASRVVESFMKRSLEDVLALFSDPALLASEWELEQKASIHMPFQPSSRSSASQASSPIAQSTSIAGNIKSSDGGSSNLPELCRKESTGICVQDYNTETEEYIELLLSKPENERKKKLGSRLFPLIKGMGYKDSTKLTVWILDHMGHDVRTMAYTLNDPAKLCDIVNEAQQSLGAPK